MAKEKNNKEKEDNRGTSPSCNFLNALIKGADESDCYNHIETKQVVIDTGSLILSSAIKVRSGSSLRLVSECPEAGKSSQAFLFAKNYMAAMPKSKTIYVKAESRLSEELQKRTGLTFVFKPDDWQIGTVFVFESNTFEIIADTLKGLLKVCHQHGEHLCIIIDSLDGLILKNDLDKTFLGGENVVVAGVPRLTKLLYRHIGLPVNKYNALLILLSQYSNQIKLDPYAKSERKVVESSGGNSISFQADYILNYLPRFKGNLILKKEKELPDISSNPILGFYCDIEIKKSATDNTGYRLSIPIRKATADNPKSGIWVEKEVADLILSFELAKRAGAWITFSEQTIQDLKEVGLNLKESVQGINGLYDYLEENQEIKDYFLNKFKKMLAS